MAFLSLEVTAVHLFLDAGTAVRLWADAAIVLAVGGCASLALFHRRERAGDGAGDGSAAEAGHRRGALAHGTDREPRARGGGRPGGRP
ncbi:hypothetical protein [Streptomyces amakusaensis]|uniref:Uncharacterized protein n=1 Tax=Streptomyces amakusaensis TaxID=67271 RepID=A0ABW0AK10_9ACTN